jgi:hypothetical protein
LTLILRLILPDRTFIAADNKINYASRGKHSNTIIKLIHLPKQIGFIGLSGFLNDDKVDFNSEMVQQASESETTNILDFLSDFKPPSGSSQSKSYQRFDSVFLGAGLKEGSQIYPTLVRRRDDYEMRNYSPSINLGHSVRFLRKVAEIFMHDASERECITSLELDKLREVVDFNFCFSSPNNMGIHKHASMLYQAIHYFFCEKKGRGYLKSLSSVGENEIKELLIGFYAFLGKFAFERDSAFDEFGKITTTIGVCTHIGLIKEGEAKFILGGIR